MSSIYTFPPGPPVVPRALDVLRSRLQALEYPPTAPAADPIQQCIYETALGEMADLLIAQAEYIDRLESALLRRVGEGSVPQ